MATVLVKMAKYEKDKPAQTGTPRKEEKDKNEWEWDDWMKFS